MWQEISRTALLGTDQTGLPDALRRRMEELDLPIEEDPARSLLTALAAIGQMRKAGKTIASYREELPEPAAPEEATACPEKALRYLEVLLRDRQPELLREFFQLLNRHQRVLPPETLPELIEATRKQPELLAQVVAAAGTRGRWLLEHHEPFRTLAAEPDPQHWHTGTPDQRVAFLEYLRRHAPDSARELLAETWAQEDYRQRARLIGTFAIHRDEEDETLLNTALADGRQEVRLVAADLLARLDRSDFAERMRERAEAVIRFEGKWKIDLPETPTAEVVADGVAPKRADSLSGGVRANYLVQLLRFVHPDYWLLMGHTTEEVAAGWVGSEHADNALHGLARATILHEAPDWATVLLQTALANPQLRFLDDRLRKDLLHLVPEEAFNELLRTKLAAIGGVPGPRHPVLPILRDATQSFSDKLAFRLIKPLQTLDRFQANQVLAYLYPVLMNAALRISPQLYKSFDMGWNRAELQMGNGWEMVDSFQQLLLFRREMAQSFVEP